MGTKERPNGYWKNRDNIEKALVEIVQKLGYFPKVKELKKMGCGGLVQGANQYHEGLFVFRKELCARLGIRYTDKSNRTMLETLLDGGNENG